MDGWRGNVRTIDMYLESKTIMVTTGLDAVPYIEKSFNPYYKIPKMSEYE